MGRRGPLTRKQLKPLKRVQLISAHTGWRGRNSKLTRAMLNEICGYLEEGLPVIRTCHMVGLSEESWYKWEKKGLEYLETGARAGDEMYGIFVEETRRSIARWQLNALRRSLGGRGGENYKNTWYRDMMLLERRDRQNWGRQDSMRIQVGGTVGPDERFL